ncbi:MAG: hypothetical protein A2Y61_05585 [Chloroflexi bacterium RBG_13_60_13]|nr:MAG: hypothetical protein A2Y61_05585 [Chloroflexi bacterium RBG_13_60_13]
MGSTDFPFSITSKFIDAGGAEHLVTVRAPTVEAFNTRLQEASTLFPYAGFTNGATVPAPAPTPTHQPPAHNPPPSGNLTQDANTRGAAAAVNTKDVSNGNGHKCAEHQRPLIPSRYGGWYCPAKNEDGTYCAVKIAA